MKNKLTIDERIDIIYKNYNKIKKYSKRWKRKLKIEFLIKLKNVHRKLERNNHHNNNINDNINNYIIILQLYYYNIIINNKNDDNNNDHNNNYNYNNDNNNSDDIHINNRIMV